MSSESGSCEEIRNASVSGGLGNSAVHISRSSVVGENDNNELLFDVEEKGAEDLKSVTSSPAEMIKSEASPSPTTTMKGFGLKKWKRIKRDVSKVGESSVDSGRMVMQELSSSIVHPSKRTQVYAKRHQKLEDSVSSSNAVVEDSVSSTNSVDSSSKYEMPIVVGTPLDKSRKKSLSGKNLAHSRGEQVRMTKETSYSSIESDSRSTDFVFVQGPYTTSNGIQSDRPVHCDRENGDEQVRNGHGREKEGALHDHSSAEVQSEKREKIASFSDQDPLIESIFVLKTAQEALEKEVLKFKEISEETSIRYAALDTQPDFEDFGAKFQETSSGKRENCEDVANGDVEIANRDLQGEVEQLFVQRIEAEVEYMVISRMVQKLRVGAVEQITYLEEQTRDKGVMLKKEFGKRETCEHIASADATLKLQKRVCVYTSYFLMQLLLLLLILGVFIFKFSPNYFEVVPT